jgi:predicted dehydrogenase
MRSRRFLRQLAEVSVNKIRVGIIGVQPGRSWAAVAHIPALRALREYEITALSTTRQSSADAAAAHFNVPQAFDNHQALVNAPNVDLVVVAVKLPHHLELVSAAIVAGKHVYCEWPLGNGLAEAEHLAALARAKGIHAAIGLQARVSPALIYVRDLIQQGYVGEVLSSSLIGTGANWGEYVDAPNAYTADRANGVTLLTIPVAHTMDAVCQSLSEVRAVSALLANRRQTTIRADTGEALPLTAEDQVAVTATLESGTVLTAHYRGGMSAGTGLLWEINGTRGDLRVTGAFGHMQITDVALSGASNGEQTMAPLKVPDSYYHTSLREGPALNVAEAYACLANDLREHTTTCPTFEDAVIRHRMVDAIERSAATGTRLRV